jgi:hypothetical protein
MLSLISFQSIQWVQTPSAQIGNVKRVKSTIVKTQTKSVITWIRKRNKKKKQPVVVLKKMNGVLL